jgi:hypothetical protein
LYAESHFAEFLPFCEGDAHSLLKIDIVHALASFLDVFRGLASGGDFLQDGYEIKL